MHDLQYKYDELNARLAKLEAAPMMFGARPEISTPTPSKVLTPQEIVALLLIDREIGETVRQKINQLRGVHER